MFVRRIDQALQIIRRAITAFRRKRQNAVIAPISCARKFCNGHQLNCGDSKLCQTRQFLCDAREAAKQSDMKFINCCLPPGSAAPSSVAPMIRAWINNDARAMDIARLRSRRRVRHFRAVCQNVFVTRASSAIGLDFKPARIIASHCQWCPVCNRYRHLFLARRPNSESGSVRRGEVCAKRQMPL